MLLNAWKTLTERLLMSQRDDAIALSPQAEQEGIFDRIKLVLGDEGIDGLRDSTVMLLGLGGVGSNCAVALARGGIGHLVLVDRDVVAPSNINRQAVAFHSTLGRTKCEVMREIVLDINPECEVNCLAEFLEVDRIAEQLDALPHPDWVIDAIDTIAQKLAIATWAQERGLRLTSSMGGANKLDPTRFKVADIFETSGDPIAKVMRKECRKRGIDALEVVYSDETPLRFEVPEGVETEQGGRPVDRSLILATMSYIPSVIGLTIAGRVICGLAGLENPGEKKSIWW